MNDAKPHERIRAWLFGRSLYARRSLYAMCLWGAAPVVTARGLGAHGLCVLLAPTSPPARAAWVALGATLLGLWFDDDEPRWIPFTVAFVAGAIGAGISVASRLAAIELNALALLPWAFVCVDSAFSLYYARSARD